jgi:hypothetical protein
MQVNANRVYQNETELGLVHEILFSHSGVPGFHPRSLADCNE